MIITLFGYMGCGKSSLGKLLAENLNYAFIDLDLHIENLHGMPVKDIFQLEGEVYFRKIESEILATYPKWVFLLINPPYEPPSTQVPTCSSLFGRRTMRWRVQKLL